MLDILICDDDKAVADELRELLWEYARRTGDALDITALTSAKDVIDGELSALLNGELGGRKSPSEKILFFADGLGINDLACGEWYYQKALRDGIGTMLEL